MDLGNSPENNYFKEYKDLGDEPANFLMIEVQGPIENALDLRSTIEKLEYEGIGMSAILTMEEMSSRKYTTIYRSDR